MIALIIEVPVTLGVLCARMLLACMVDHHEPLPQVEKPLDLMVKLLVHPDGDYRMT